MIVIITKRRSIVQYQIDMITPEGDQRNGKHDGNKKEEKHVEFAAARQIIL